MEIYRPDDFLGVGGIYFGRLPLPSVAKPHPTDRGLKSKRLMKSPDVPGTRS